MVRHAFVCSNHPEPREFDVRRSMKEGGNPAPCPACGTECKQVVRFNPRRQMHVHSRFGVTIPTTGFKTFYGGGDWEHVNSNGVGGYHKWDSDFAGPLPGNDLPAHMR